ncbi:hypothetical protein F0562_028779 [Nyssa sinensis]|uniref:MADS-box domain-containing protein n=1 Tax=Nyssa sinensis TaxID=561372 RepID=A0A5J5B581_9ASTE|nr:hypothetical protein F0562_028779 [Nyssa sinensis]
MARKSKGRQKIEMTRMSKESNLLVTFSKRRSGLFKKASELCTLCGAEIAIIVFSPGKKVFSFGHPCVESIIDRFLTRNPPPNSSTFQLVEAHRSASVRELNTQLTEVLNQLEAEKQCGEELTKVRKASQNKRWWEAPIEELGLQELEQLKVAMEELKENVAKQADKVVKETSNALPISGASSSMGGLVGGGAFDAKFSGLGLSMTPYGYTLEYGHNINKKKTSQGRKKIEIKKIEQLNNRQVTFSKRRSGLFKKAGELCILTGAEVAIVVLSPGNRVFAFGHPNVDAVVERYFTGSSPSQLNKNPVSAHEFNRHYLDASAELEAEKNRRVVIEEEKTVGNGGFWWDVNVDELGLEELEQYKAALEEMRQKVAVRADELMLMKASSAMNLNANSVGASADYFVNQNADYGTTAMVPHGFGFGRWQF